MKIKIFTIVIILFIVNSGVIALADFKINNDIKDVEGDVIIKNIRVALLYEQPSGSFIGTAKRLFPLILQKSWMVGNISYNFVVTPIYDKDIINGSLNLDNYDMLLCPGGDVGDGEALAKGFFRLPKAKKWKDNIAQFIKDGGGYYGVCGGASMFTGLSKNPTTFYERQFDKCDIGVSCAKLYYDVANPVLYPFQRFKAEKIGAALYFFAFPFFDMEINNSHPIFDDFFESTRRMSWIGGPAFVLPENPKREIDLLSNYPADLSENESLKVHVWRYTGGFLGMIRGIPHMIEYYKSYGFSMIEILTLTPMFYRFAIDWEKTDKILDLNYSGKVSNFAEIYPNENKGRIVLDGAHPDYPVSFGGRIEEAEDTCENYLNGLYRWVDAIPFEDTPEDEYTYNYWIIRRQVAWAAKVADNDLPPVYGVSQVSDIIPYEQPSSFRLAGNVEYDKNIISVDLYYRYSKDNSSWTVWKFHDIDNNADDGWFWDFNSPDGPGYYQFYSSAKVNLDEFIQVEKAPPGPDAIVEVVS